MERLEAKIDKLVEDISQIKSDVAVNTKDLAHHMKRTDILERKVDSIPAKVLLFLSLMSGVITLIKILH